MKNKNTTQSDFKGFDDFIELFTAGTRTDSAGRSATWTTDDLDQMVANHSAADAAPIVIGHPKDDASSFAYGWTDQIKRVGNKLLGKFAQVDPGFEQLIKDGKLKNRSIRILKGPEGFKLGHVGWLGATPPAVSGLKPVEFASADEVFDFSMAEWQSTGIMARMLRNMREFLISQFGQEKADSVLPNYDIDELNRLSEQQYQDERAEQQAEANDSTVMPSSFSQPQQDNAMTVTQADLDAAKQQADAAKQQVSDFAAQNQALQQQLDAERIGRKRLEYQAVIDKHKTRGVAPALLEGAVDFMLQLDDGETGVFEFSVGGDNAKKTVKQLDFVQGLLDALPAAVKPGRVDFSGDPNTETASDFSAPGGTIVDPEALKLHSQVLDYQTRHNCDFQSAVKAVVK